MLSKHTYHALYSMMQWYENSLKIDTFREAIISEVHNDRFLILKISTRPYWSLSKAIIR